MIDFGIYRKMMLVCFLAIIFSIAGGLFLHASWGIISTLVCAIIFLIIMLTYFLLSRYTRELVEFNDEKKHKSFKGGRR